MIKGNIIITVIILAILFNACDKIINVQIPGGNNQLVVNATFCPDSIISLKLSKSQNVLDQTKIAYINNANIYIYTNYVILDTLKNIGNGLYVCNQKPLANKPYTIKVEAPGFGIVQATDTIPELVKIQKVDTSIVNNGPKQLLNCTISFTDPINIANYYLLRILSADIANPKNMQQQKYTCYDPMITNSPEYDTLAGGNIMSFDDSQMNGKKHSILVSMSYPKNKIVFFQLWSISQALCNYIISIAANRASIPSGGLFNFNAPNQVTSNIIGGLGIIAAYSISNDSLMIK